jgi:hypothetical protein
MRFTVLAGKVKATQKGGRCHSSIPSEAMKRTNVIKKKASCTQRDFTSTTRGTTYAVVNMGGWRVQHTEKYVPHNSSYTVLHRMQIFYAARPPCTMALWLTGPFRPVQ